MGLKSCKKKIKEISASIKAATGTEIDLGDTDDLGTTFYVKACDLYAQMAYAHILCISYVAT